VSAPRVALPAGIRDARTYSPELEGMRGIAILLVFLYHAILCVEPGTRAVGSAWAFLYAGHTGVTLFFVLSAFLLSRPFLAQAAGGPRANVRRFFERRALRILPAYYCAVVVATVVKARQLADLERGLPYLVFLNSFPGLASPLSPWSDPWWSLATECQFYLLLPLLGFLLGSPVGRGVGAIGLFFYAAAYLGFASGTLGATAQSAHWYLALSAFGRGPAFLAGIAVAFLCERFGTRIRGALQRRSWIRNGGADALLVLVLFALGSVLAPITRVGFLWAERRWPAWHAPESLLWSLVLLLVLLAPLRVGVVVRSRLLRWAGVISYSLYLVHLPIVWEITLRTLALEHPGLTTRALAAIAVALAASVVVSALTYRWIERPFLTRKARITG